MSDASSRSDPDRDVVEEGSPLAPGRGAGRPATDDPYTEDPNGGGGSDGAPAEGGNGSPDGPGVERG